MNRTFLVFFILLSGIAIATHHGGEKKDMDKMTRAQNESDVLNTCIDGQHHKTTPGPESDLYQKCSPWKDRACCTNDTAYQSHQDGADGLYNFNYNHCSVPMSSKCRERFQENNCFYECSPNVGPWIVTEGTSYRNERFKDVPVCQSTCESWWYDCKDDFTCKDNWSVGWNWTSGVNECPSGSECHLFSEIFPTPLDLCNVFPGDFNIVPDDSDPCMVLWFEGENPNDEVAKHYAKEMGLCCGATTIKHSTILSLLLTSFIWFWNK